MELLDSLIEAIRIYLIPLGAIIRCIFCFINIKYNEDERKVNIKRIFNTLAFLILSEVIFEVLDIVKYYYTY